MKIPLAVDFELARYHRLNLALLTGHAGSALLAYFGLAFLARSSDPLWCWGLLPLMLLSNGYWATLHEAIHGQLLSGAKANRRAGRVLAILWGSSFRLLRFGHLMHHRFNRHKLDRPDVYDPGTTSALAARLRFFTELFGGLYLIEVLTPLFSLLPRPAVRHLVSRLYAGDEMTRLRPLALQALSGEKGIAEIRQDGAAAVLLLAAGFLAWGPWWMAFAGFVAGRGLLVSLIDNVHHFRTPLDQVDYAYNLSVPAPLGLLLLNMNMHRVHHRHVQAPWWLLPRCFVTSHERFDDTLVNAALRQLSGPVATPGRQSGGRLD